METKVFSVPGRMGYSSREELSMTPDQLAGLVLAVLLMLVGLAGTLLPAIPGSPLIFVVAVAHRLYFGSHGPSILVLALLFGLMMLAMILDFLASSLGAKKLGATWRGIVGAILGATVGLFFPPFGLLAGPFIGAVGGELLGGRRFEESTKAGAGALIGLLVGMVGKFACCCAMIGLFVFSVVLRGG
jgi:uncharacterized protein